MNSINLSYQGRYREPHYHKKYVLDAIFAMRLVQKTTYSYLSKFEILAATKPTIIRQIHTASTVSIIAYNDKHTLLTSTEYFGCLLHDEMMQHHVTDFILVMQ